MVHENVWGCNVIQAANGFQPQVVTHQKVGTFSYLKPGCHLKVEKFHLEIRSQLKVGTFSYLKPECHLKVGKFNMEIYRSQLKVEKIFLPQARVPSKGRKIPRGNKKPAQGRKISHWGRPQFHSSKDFTYIIIGFVHFSLHYLQAVPIEIHHLGSWITTCDTKSNWR